MNTSPVRFILFPANNDNTQKILDIDNLRLRRLAYLIGGIGYIQCQKSITWIINNKKISLAWSHQGSDRDLDFTIPWRMCMWQSSRKLTPTTLSQHAGITIAPNKIGSILRGQQQHHQRSDTIHPINYLHLGGSTQDMESPPPAIDRNPTHRLGHHPSSHHIQLPSMRYHMAPPYRHKGT